jgi:hypothetical protein
MDSMPTRLQWGDLANGTRNGTEIVPFSVSFYKIGHKEDGVFANFGRRLREGAQFARTPSGYNFEIIIQAEP